MPTMISSTIAGSRNFGARPKTSGTANATAETITRLSKLISEIPGQSPVGGRRYALLVAM
jgi:hypothetical protein